MPATSSNAPLTWTSLGKLSAMTAPDCGGVYLIVHEGKFNRVLYVGTTRNFSQRLATHLIGFMAGNRSIWKVSGQDDPYAFMTAWNLRNDVSHFKRLAELDLLWGATTLDRVAPHNLLASAKPFSLVWRNFLETEYLPRISAWGLKLAPYNARTAVLIESAIQQRLVKLFRLGRFFNHPALSLLGKIEFNDRLVRIRRPFTNLPDVDEASKLVFASLDAKELPAAAEAIAEQQLEEVIVHRALVKLAREERRKKMLLRYPKQGTQWTPVDVEKLRVMLVDFDMGPADIAPLLGRQKSSIARKIERSDKLTAGAWRKGAA